MQARPPPTCLGCPSWSPGGSVSFLRPQHLAASSGDPCLLLSVSLEERVLRSCLLGTLCTPFWSVRGQVLPPLPIRLPTGVLEKQWGGLEFLASTWEHWEASWHLGCELGAVTQISNLSVSLAFCLSNKQICKLITKIKFKKMKCRSTWYPNAWELVCVLMGAVHASWVYFLSRLPLVLTMRTWETPWA